jgi:carbonic anhydrase
MDCINLDFNRKGAETLVLSCIDPRFIEFLTHFLNHSKDSHQEYDLFNLAGSELGVLHNSKWQDIYFEHIDIALSLHKIKELWIFSHLDCGAYKTFLKLEKDDNHNLHCEKINKLKEILNKKYPQLKIQSYLMTTHGEIIKIY